MSVGMACGVGAAFWSCRPGAQLLLQRGFVPNGGASRCDTQRGMMLSRTWLPNSTKQPLGLPVSRWRVMITSRTCTHRDPASKSQTADGHGCDSPRDGYDGPTSPGRLHCGHMRCERSGRRLGCGSDGQPAHVQPAKVVGHDILGELVGDVSQVGFEGWVLGQLRPCDRWEAVAAAAAAVRTPRLRWGLGAPGRPRRWTAWVGSPRRSHGLLALLCRCIRRRRVTFGPAGARSHHAGCSSQRQGAPGSAKKSAQDDHENQGLTPLHLRLLLFDIVSPCRAHRLRAAERHSEAGRRPVCVRLLAEASQTGSARPYSGEMYLGERALDWVAVQRGASPRTADGAAAAGLQSSDGMHPTAVVQNVSGLQNSGLSSHSPRATGWPPAKGTEGGRLATMRSKSRVKMLVILQAPHDQWLVESRALDCSPQNRPQCAGRCARATPTPLCPRIALAPKHTWWHLTNSYILIILHACTRS